MATSPRVSSVAQALEIASRFTSRKRRIAPPGCLSPELTISQEYVQLGSNMPVRVEFAPVHYDFPAHDHEFYEVSIITGGSALHYTQESQHMIEAGSVIIMAPGQVHGFARTKDFSLINIYYLAEWFLGDMQALRNIDNLIALFFQKALFPQQPSPVRTLHIPSATLGACRRDLEDLYEETLRADCDPLYLESCLLKCLVRITRAWSESLLRLGEAPTQKTEVHPAHNALPALVTTALLQLETDAQRGNSLNISKIAKAAGVSQMHFCRQFKASMGMSAGTYFQRCRIHIACRRLLASEESLTQIAHSLGYSDSAHFSRFFKSITGLPPGAYRKKFSQR